MKKVTKFLRDMDSISEPSYTQLHFKEDEKQRSVFGGIISIVVLMFLIRIIFENGFKWISLDEPYI